MNPLIISLLSLLAILAAARPVPTPRRTLITGGSAVAGELRAVLLATGYRAGGANTP